MFEWKILLSYCPMVLIISQEYTHVYTLILSTSHMVNTRTFIAHSSTVSIIFLRNLQSNVFISLLKLGFAHACILQGLSGPGRLWSTLGDPTLRSGKRSTLFLRTTSMTSPFNLIFITALLRYTKGKTHISLWYSSRDIATYTLTIVFANWEVVDQFWRAMWLLCGLAQHHPMSTCAIEIPSLLTGSCKGMGSVLLQVFYRFSDCSQVLLFRFTQEAIPSQILDLPQEIAL